MHMFMIDSTLAGVYITRRMQALWGEPERASRTLAVMWPREWAMTGMEHTCMMGVGE